MIALMTADPMIPAGETPDSGLAITLANIGESGEDLADATAVLDSAERERAAKFKFDLHRHRFIRRRALLRQLLGTRLDVNPSDICYAVSEFGKPSISGIEGLDLEKSICFNASSSADTAAFAIGASGPVGIDIETVDLQFPGLEVAETHFVENEVALLRSISDLADRTRQFFRFWTAKEALMKASGLGLQLTPKSIEVTTDPSGTPTGYRVSDRRVDGTGWECESTSHPDHEVCVATEAS